MDKLVKGHRLMTIVLAVMVSTALVSTVKAEEDMSPNKGRISVSANVDFVTQYWFRGLAQENQGYIIQPGIDVGINLFSADEDGLNSIDVNFGVWNSFHGGPTGDDGAGTVDPKALWETDWYAGLSATLIERLTVGMTYTALTSPNDSFATIDDLSFSFEYDDAGLWGDGFLASGLQPSFMIAFEIGDNGADAGGSTGVYYELGLAPSWAVFNDVTLSVPMTFGFGSDYYEDGLGNDDAFGYFDVGADIGVPLSFIPADYGSWSLTAGVHMIVLGDTAQTIAGPAGFGVTGGEDVEVYGKVGIGFEY